MQHQTETVERLEQEIRDADQTGATLEERLARLRQTIEDNDAAGADKRRQLEEITRQSQALLDSGDSNTKETTELNRKLSDLTLQLSDAKVQASAAASSMEEIGQRSGSVDDLLAACGKETQRILAQQQESQENLAFLQQRIDENSNALSGYQMKLQGKTAAAEKIKSKLDELAAAVQQKQQSAVGFREEYGGLFRCGKGGDPPIQSRCAAGNPRGTVPADHRRGRPFHGH